MKTVNKVIVMFLVFTITICTSTLYGDTVVLASDDTNILFQNDEIKILLLEERINYQNIEIVDFETNTSSFMEYYSYEDGDMLIKVAESNGDNLLVSRDDNIITTMQNGVVIDKQYMFEQEAIPEVSFYNNNLLSARGWSSWGCNKTISTSKSARMTVLTTAIGVISSISGLGKAASTVVTVATGYYSLKSKNVYYKIQTCYRYDKKAEKIQGKSYVRYYKYYNYTGYIGSTTRYFNVSWD